MLRQGRFLAMQFQDIQADELRCCFRFVRLFFCNLKKKSAVPQFKVANARVLQEGEIGETGTYKIVPFCIV